MAAITPQSATITSREAEQVERANASGKTPVVLIHGLWLLPSSWDRWTEPFEEAGYAAVTPIIDSGWREVADTALRFVRRFT